MDTKNKTHIYTLYKRPTSDLGTQRLKVRGWKKIFHPSRNQRRGGVAMFIADNIDYKIKNVTRDKEGCYLMIKGSIQEEDLTIINIYVPNIRAPQYKRKMLNSIKGEINKIQ